MTKKRKLEISDDNVEQRFANWVAQLVGIMQPWSLYIVAGRASAKTVQILAERLQEAVYDCPGAPFAWVASTYSDLHKNVIPSLVDGLRILGWENGVHYVINKEPPEDWKRKMYNVCTDWKQTMTFFNGFNLTFISLDRSSIGAGRSYVGVFGDEVKYFKEEAFTNLLKAVRGFRVRYGQSVWYRSRTLTTDMPNPNHLGEYDWILKLAKQNDNQRILIALRAGFVYNEVKKELACAMQREEKLRELVRRDPSRKAELQQVQRELDMCKRNAERWRLRWEVTRRNLSFFFICSSLVNADILGVDWFSDEFSEGLEGLECNILSIIPKMESSRMFYCNLSIKNFYGDGFNNEVIEQHPFGWQQDCTVLKYLDKSAPLEGGMDAGNMLSMVFAQRKEKTLRVMKELYTLPPNTVRELADQFLAYFAPHRRKVLRLFYDRAMNNYKRVNSDMATQIKHCIEVDGEGKRTGWVVQLMSLGQGNIGSNLEYRFFMELLAGHLDARIFRILIDQYNCPMLKSEMEVTGTVIKTSPDGTSQVVKQKTGDKLPTHRLPRESTNLTDALKYLVLRREVVRLWQQGGKSAASSVI